MERNVILASKSPRRREILENLGLTVHVLAENPEIRTAFAGDEEELPGEKPDDYGRRITVEKFEKGLAMKAASPLRDAPWPVIAADTVVTIDDVVLGKPRDAEEAMAFLRRLSDRRHRVVTHVCVGTTRENARVLASSSDVYVRELTEDEMTRYVATGEPFDKAGGYGIQEWIGYVAIESINGSFYNVMGLPVQRLYVELDRFLSQQAG